MLQQSAVSDIAGSSPLSLALKLSCVGIAFEGIGCALNPERVEEGGGGRRSDTFSYGNAHVEYNMAAGVERRRRRKLKNFSPRRMRNK